MVAELARAWLRLWRRGRSAPGIALWLVATSMCGCGSGSDSAAPAPTALEAPQPLPRGTPLGAGWSAYPRAVRLAHQDNAAHNGRIVVSLTEVEGVLQAGFHVSDDDGASFRPSFALRDPAFRQGLCCGTLFEMPVAVGLLSAGTLLYAASVGQDTNGVRMEHRIYRSDDAGASFRRLEGATCGRAAVPRSVAGAAGTGVWEPEFFIAGDGSLACVYSDETDAGHSQVIKLTRTRDGDAWSEPVTVVAGTNAAARPGMPVVRRLPSGRYAMTLESCTLDRLDCSARLKLSDDGLDWGPLGTLGIRPQTAEGQYFRHAPTLAWTSAAGRDDGMWLLIGQIVVAGNDRVDMAQTGRILFTSTAADGSGPWAIADAPIGLPVPPQQTNPCQNYSTALLPSADGSQLLVVQTDRSDGGGCSARFGRGPLLAVGQGL